jgi:hypothetical protein
VQMTMTTKRKSIYELASIERANTCKNFVSQELKLICLKWCIFLEKDPNLIKARFTNSLRIPKSRLKSYEIERS